MLHASQTPTSDLSAAALAAGSVNSTTVVQLLPVAPTEPSLPRGGLALWQVSRVKRHIDDNLEDPIQVSDLARIARLSAGYFSNAFRTSLGTSPHAYIVSRRLARAMNLMQSTGSPLCEIAMDCGFSDQAHLCRQFRRATGTSPNAWRRMNPASSTVRHQ